jgi:hypothetical protein
VLAGVLCVLVLAAALYVVRAHAHARAHAREGETARADEAARSGARAWSGGTSRREITIGALAVLAAGVPVLSLAPWIAGRPVFWGDDMTHARVAAEIAHVGLPHGWIDSYMGGFPFAHHYPPVGALLVAALIRLGASPAAATDVLGALGTFAAPLVLYAAFVRAGARVPIAILAAIALAWVSPYNPFVGGYEAFFQIGLFSQVIALPLCIALGSSVASARSPWTPTILGAAAMATHPQLTTATLLVALLASLAAWRRAIAIRAARAGVAALAAGAALYGQGLATLHVPFGWPPNLAWLQLGFPPSRLSWWLLDGDLLDSSRAPVLTALATAAVFALALLAATRRSATARGAIVAIVVALLGSVAGHALAEAGAIGSILLAFLQPLRMVALAPVVAAAAVGVALEEGVAQIATAAHARADRRVSRFAPVALLTVVLGLELVALPSRVSYAAAVRAEVATLSDPRAPCGPSTPGGYAKVRASLATLAPDRLWYDQGDPALLRCALDDDLELAIPGPVAMTGGVGSHVGLHWLAFRQIGLGRPGAAARAEALGVRYVLRTTAGRAHAEPPAGFTIRSEDGETELMERTGGTNLVGVGCVAETWRGSDAALRDRLEADLVTTRGQGALLDPEHFVVLDRASGPLHVERATAATAATGDACGAGARVEEVPREPGAVEARVESTQPVVVVLRVTAFPSWRAEIDGAAAPLEMVAPGFPALRVPAGEHRIVAVAGAMPGYGLALLAGALGVVLTGLVRRDALARVRARLERRPG